MNSHLHRLALGLATALALALAACQPSAMPTPVTQTPTSEPFVSPTLLLTPEAPSLVAPTLNDVRKKLGYVLVPDDVPPGLSLCVSLRDTQAQLVYWEGVHFPRFALTYPAYYADLPYSGKAPPGAVSDVQVRGRSAKLVRGALGGVWRQGETPEPARWLYELGTTLSFTVAKPDGRAVGATLRAYPHSEDTAETLVRMAESIRLVDMEAELPPQRLVRWQGDCG